MRPLPGEFRSPIVGVTFAPAYPAGIDALERHFLTRQLAGKRPPSLDLVRDARNEFDPCAVQVHLLGEVADRYEVPSMLGHLPRDVVARLAPELDDKVEWRAECEVVVWNRENPSQPGVRLRAWRVGGPE